MTPARILDGAALAVLVVQIVFRLTAWSEYASWGSKLFMHLMIFLAGGCWFAARALDGKMKWRFSGFELPLGGLGLLAVISMLRGPAYPLAAIDGAVAYGSMALLLPLAFNFFQGGRRHLLFSLLHGALFTVALYALIQYFWVLPATAASKELAKYIATAGDLAVDLAIRVRSPEPWGTLFYPNTFAGFLVLLMPFAAGSLLDIHWKFSGAVVMRVLSLAMAAFALKVSGSRGGQVAMVVAIAVFGVQYLVWRFPGRRKVLLGSALGAAALAGILGLVGYHKIVQRVESLEIRDVYWDAALRTARDHPVLGVGINNYQEYFTQYKDERQEESIRVHNDYLEILAELGIAGLICFLGILAVALRKSLRPDPTPPGPDGGGWTLSLIGVFLGFCFAFAFQNSFSEGGPWLPLGLAAAWAGSMFVSGPGERSLADRDPVFTRMGLIAGIAGVAVHFLVDFDFHDYGFAETFVVALAALALLSRNREPVETRGWVPGLVGALCFAIVLPVFAIVMPKWLESDDLRKEADANLRERHIPEALDSFHRAAELNELEPTLHLQSALIHFEQWKVVMGGKGTRTLAEVASGEKTISDLQAGLKHRPRWGTAWFWIAYVRQVMARDAREVAGSEAMAKKYLEHGEECARKAIAYYPTRAENRYLLGRILDFEGRGADAEASYREALRLGSRSIRVPRLRMNGFQRAVCLFRTGGSIEDAIGAMRDFIGSTFIESRPGIRAAEIRERLADLDRRPAVYLDGYDESMRELVTRSIEKLSGQFPER